MTSTQTGGVVGFDPLSQEFAQNPYPAYASLRAQEEPWYFPDFDIWMLARHDAVNEVVLDKTMVRNFNDYLDPAEIKDFQRKSNWHDMPHHERFVQFSMLDSDGPIHDRLRRHVFREFTPAFIAKQRGMIQAYVDRLVESLLDKGEIDFIEDLAAHVPGHIIGNLLGVPDEDCPQLRIWSENVVQYFDINRTAERKALAEQATKEFYEYLLKLIEIRRADPREDVLCRLMKAWDDGQMTEDEMISTCMLILMAGHGSTIDVLGSGMHALLKNPEQMQRLRDDPTLINTAIQEMFRYESPLPFFHRFSTTECTVMGKTFPAGTKFGLLYGAANRDPNAFVDADTFDVGRSPNRHLAFGGGAHFCLGNHLARLDMEVIFTTLLKKMKTITLLEEPVYKTGLSVRGVHALKIGFELA